MHFPLRTTAAVALLSTLAGCSNPRDVYDYVLTSLEGSTETKDPWAPPSTYRALHDRAPAIIDMHADTFVMHPERKYLDRLMVNEDRKGQVDIPRLIEGNVALQDSRPTARAPSTSRATCSPA